ncbi:redoxin domain-containing protein [Pseudanabaena sp. FACHB-2040]|uniref:peroxiredoxin family protein n=1 Tax=Pseudanabaena sp. FACHB-2040 TaxID=2692859 RepID=UPI001688B597|nr:redoxin domain-containing protein [Pseudanabaena sp. FACHB-2040]MBD2260850.1 redoxin domain-containing protein [Pseudanabaena sp. FACHB-2040]
MTVSTDFEGLITRRFFKHFLPIPGQRRLLVGQFAPDFALRDVTHQRTVRLSNYRAKQPLVLAFTRIFTEKQYCPFCFPHILAMNEAYEQFLARGAEVLMITSTDLRQSQIVVRDLGLNLPLLSDESCQSFHQYHTGQALGAPLSAQFVLDPQGRLRYSHMFSFLEHNAGPEKLLAILDVVNQGQA